MGGPTHRYSFSETANANAEDAEFRDSIGTAHGTVRGAGGSFSGTRLILAGGPSTDAAYGDLPNALLSQNSTNNGGTGEFAIETWVKITGSRTWSRVFDIGSSTTDDGTGEVIFPAPGGEGRDYLEYSAQIGDDVNNRRLELRNEDPAGGGIVTADVPTSTFNTDHQVLVSWKESTGQVRVYENGADIGGLTTDDAMSDINDVNVNETTGTQVTDSVGNAHGEAIGNATFAGGTLTLDGADGTYVNLPNGIITALGTNATFEMWITYAGGPNWSRVFDFGTSTGGEDVSDGGPDVDYVFLTAKTAQGFPRFESNFPNGGVTTTVNHPVRCRSMSRNTSSSPTVIRATSRGCTPTAPSSRRCRTRCPSLWLP